MKKLFILIATLFLAITLVSCKDTEVSQYHVWFDDNEANEQVETQLVKEGEFATRPSVELTKEGFKFEYWELESKEFHFETTPITEETVLIAKWEEIQIVEATFSVKFMVDNILYKTESVIENEFLTTVEEPVKEGYIFDYWQLDNLEYDFTSPVTKDITLVAIWKEVPANSFVVTFDSSGGSKVDDQFITNGGLVVKPTTSPIKDGYTFEHWLLNNVEYDFGQTVTEDIILVAKWKLNDILPPVDGEVTLTHQFDYSKLNIEGTLVVGDKNFSSTNIITGDNFEFTRNNSTINRNTFMDVTGIILHTNKTSNYADSSLTTNFQVKDLSKVIVDFAVWGKKDQQQLNLVKSIFIQTSTDGINWVNQIDIKPLIKNEQDFQSSVNIEGNFGNSYIRIFTESSKTTSNFEFRFIIKGLKIYSVEEPFTGETFTVYFDTKDGLPVNFEQRVRDGRKALVPEVPSRAGYRFAGWYVSGTEDVVYDFNELVTADLNLYAKWNEIIEGENPSDSDPNIIKYYKSLEGLVGSAFNAELRRIIERTGTNTGTTEELKQVDKFNGRNYNIYDGYSAYGNREHVWPNSKLGDAPKYDLHNLRAAITATNSKRSNYPFGEGSGNWKLTSGKFYPGDEHVGDVARIVLYIHVRYGLDLNKVGNLAMFLKWHEQDPVNDFERSRNNNIEDLQNNRNPFIDYPDYVTTLLSSNKTKMKSNILIQVDYMSLKLNYAPSLDKRSLIS